MLVGESEQNIQDRVESGDICQSEKYRVAKKQKNKKKLREIFWTHQVDCDVAD